MNLLNNIENTFSERSIIYFKGNNLGENMLNVPYRGIKDPSRHINIYLEINEELNNIRFTFVEKCNKAMALDEIKSQLLDINSSLQFGSLAMKNDSDSVEYKIDYILADNVSFSWDKYNLLIVHCVKTYELLKDKAII